MLALPKPSPSAVAAAIYLDRFDRSKEVIEHGDGMCTCLDNTYEVVYKSLRDDEGESG